MESKISSFRKDDYSPAFILAKTLEYEPEIAGVMVVTLWKDGTHAVNCSTMSGRDVSFCQLAAQDFALRLMRDEAPETAIVKRPEPEGGR